jgi:hypothetical protein
MARGFDTPELCREDTIKRVQTIYTEVANVLRAVETGIGKETTKPYAVIKNLKKPKHDPTRYSITKSCVLGYLGSDATVLGLFETLESALKFLLKHL